MRKEFIDEINIKFIVLLQVLCQVLPQYFTPALPLSPYSFVYGYRSYVVGDSEGAISGLPGSWLVTETNTSGFLPPDNCEAVESWGARVCTDVCYRTIKVQYNESRNFDADAKEPWSFLNVRAPFQESAAVFLQDISLHACAYNVEKA